MIPKYTHYCDLDYSYYSENRSEIEDWLDNNIGPKTGGSHMLESVGKYTGLIISSGLCHSLRVKFTEKKDAIIFLFRWGHYAAPGY